MMIEVTGMGMTTMGVKLDEATRDRLKVAAQGIDRTPHWLIKQAIYSYLERLEKGDALPEIPALNAASMGESDEPPTPSSPESHQPFLDFAEQILPQSVSRSAITAAYRRPKPFPCCWSRPAYRRRWIRLRTSWPMIWPANCEIKRVLMAAPVWCRVCCRSSRSPRTKAWH